MAICRNTNLWTRGWTLRIQTYPGREVPNPLVIDISKGEADINVVLKDIPSLHLRHSTTTRAFLGDGLPITLKFADVAGEILTAGPIKDVPPLPFRHYIEAGCMPTASAARVFRNAYDFVYTGLVKSGFGEQIGSNHRLM